MIAALITGLVGSLHCLGMCGPLAMALPGQPGTTRYFFWGRLSYNLGRIGVYALLGGLVSLLGLAAAFLKLQQFVSIALGIVLIGLALRSLFSHRRKVARQTWAEGWVFKRFSWFMQHPVPGRLFILGGLNGLLPCGLVYIGLFQAALAPSPWEGMATMALFGAGTLPVMLTASLSGQWLRRHLLSRAKYVLPGLMLCMGLMLGLRGMALDIPYLSPKVVVTTDGKFHVSCHVGPEAGGKGLAMIPICK